MWYTNTLFMKRNIINEVPLRSRRSVWEQFRSDEQLRQTYNIKPEELESLSKVAMLGNVASKDDYLFMLKMMRGKRHRY